MTLLSRRAFLAGALAVTAGLAADTLASPQQVAAARRRPLISGHRGTRHGAPENTMAAFRYAHAAGADIVEFDVQWTRDGHMVIMHDKDVARTTNGRGLVSSLTLAQIRRLDAGSWYGAKWKGERVPTFGEVLEYCSLNNLTANAEVKLLPSETITAAQAQQYADEISNYSMAGNTIMSSMSHRAIRRIQALEVDGLRTAAISEVRPGTKQAIASLGEVYMPYWGTFTDGNVATMQRMGVQIAIWPARTVTDYHRCYNSGAAIVVVDDPRAFARWLAR
jgi:glycerophosphoryl diester phosphodiesterase